MDPLAVLHEENARLADAARRDLDASVAGCPGWDVADLVWHIGEVQAFWRARLAGGTDAPTEWDPPRPDRAELIGWFVDGAAELEAALRATDPEKPVWNWTGADQRAAWVRRRMAQETAVHRWDAEAATGTATPIDGEVAVDGIDELLDVFLPAGLRGTPDASLGGSLHLHATDRPGEWLVEIDGGQARVSRQHGKGDAAVLGSASDLLLALWGRVPFADLETFGDPAVLTSWQALVDLT